MMRRSPRTALALLTGLAMVRLGAAEIPPLMLGSAWYPEQWNESQWETDLSLMQQAGLNMVRIGEFAWSTLEPSEGNYQLDWMERAIAAAAKHGIVTIIGTPTDTPPAWMTTTHPEILRVSEDGKQLQHGSRRHFSIASAKYRELCARIVAQLAERFGHNPNVVAWQIGNEFTEDSFDEESRHGWHRWLEQRYGTLEQLNRQWMTAYWSQTYDQWSQIPMTTGRANPGLLLDYKRYVTDTWLAFQRNQIAVLRARIDPRQRITTNLGGLGWANRFNRQMIAADYDVISWDEYLGAGYADNSHNGTGHLDPDRSGSTHDLVRGWKQRNFWVLEMPPGFVDWSSVSNSLDRGETRAMAWHSVAHGADCVAFWQWRSALNGQEQYHGSLVGPDGEPVPVYAEVAQTGHEFAKAAPVIAGTSPESQVALIHDYDSGWAIDFNRFSNRYEQLEVLHSYYKALRQQTQSVDIIAPAADLSRYKLIVAPSLNIVSADLAKTLSQWVERGGHLVLGPRTGMKNEFNALNTQRQPGPLGATLGGRVEQFYALLEDVPVSGDWGRGTATIWAETLAPKSTDVEVLLRYGAGNDWLANQPAAIRRHVGQGSITYLGALVDASLMKQLAKQWTAMARVDSPAIAVSDRVSVGRRVGQGREVYVMTNFSASAQDIALPESMSDVLNGGETAKVHLPRYGVAVLTRRLR